jgi:adrenodoxin-NADP+ reductase
LIGRRGPLQVAFTIKEFREILKLPNVRTTLSADGFDAINDGLLSLLF